MIHISTTIESITKASRKGYIDDYDDIDKIVSRLATIPIEQLSNDCTNIILGVIRDFMEDNEMNPDRHREITFGETLCIIGSFYSCGAYTHLGMEWCMDTSMSVLCHIRIMMVSVQSANTTMRLFMSMAVSSYLEYLAMKMGQQGKSIKKLITRFKKSIKHHVDFDITETTTIKELLDKLDAYQRRCWIPRKPIKDFENEIRTSYDDLYCFLVGHFKEAFPEYFDLNNLKNKYAIKEID